MLNINDFREAAEQGLLKRNTLGSFELFNYTQECTVKRIWNETTLEGRGIVFQDGQIVCRPMRKFFNSHEPDAADTLIQFRPTTALVKLDGTLINVWHDLQGIMHVTTRGSLSNEYIDGAVNLIEERGLTDFLSLHKDVTWSFEYTYPQNRFTMPSVIPHASERLTLLNMRMTDGSEIDSEFIAEYNCALYANREHHYSLFVNSESENLLDDMVEAAKLIPYTSEGWVLSCFDGVKNHRVKVKGAQYVAMHRVIHGMTPRAIADAWYAGMCDELTTMLYEPHSGILKEKFEVFNFERDRIVNSVGQWVREFVGAFPDFERKDFVIQAQQDIPDCWQLAIKAHYDSEWLRNVDEWVVKKLVGKPPRKWEMPVTDDVNEG